MEEWRFILSVVFVFLRHDVSRADDTGGSVESILLKMTDMERGLAQMKSENMALKSEMLEVKKENRILSKVVQELVEGREQMPKRINFIYISITILIRKIPCVFLLCT